MRLTLRNLLLYLDHQMSPGDAQEFAEKIQQSEFATGLIERIRSVTRVRRMPAPKLDDKGLGGDANTVADYIENLLPAEHIKDFDKLCLDSDMQLAELASCHHILTLVLGKPLEPSEELRERMYKVPQLAASGKPRVDRAHAAEADVAPEPPPVAPPLPSQAKEEPVHVAAKSRSEVPDYLRAGRSSRLWPLVATVAVTFLIVALTLRALGPFDHRHPLAKWLGMSPAEVAGLPSDLPHEGGAAPITPAEPHEPETGALAVNQPEEAMPEEGTSEPENPIRPLNPSEPTETPEEPAPVEKPSKVALNKPEDPFVLKKPDPTEKPVTPALEPAPVEEPGVLVDVGRYLSDEQLLGRFDAKTALWMRVPPRALLIADEPLVSFPAYRPQLALTAGVQVTLVGEAAVIITAPGPDGVPSLKVDHGRLLVVTDGKPGAKAFLDLAGLKGKVTCTDPGTELAVEVRRYLPPGTDPESKASIRVIEIFTLSGAAQWQETDGDPVKIEANHAFTVVEDSIAEVRGPFRTPEWVDARPAAGSLDRDTRLALDRLIPYDKSLQLSLQERADDRRVEIRSLAARCLICLDRFTPVLADLREPKLASFWLYEADLLRAAMARSPETAALLRQELDRSRGPDTALMYRLIRGYSPEQLGTERGAVELVDALEHPELDVRVLAFDNLLRITGAMYGYRPERKPEQNRAPLVRFRERLKEGTLTYKTLPTALPERKPLGK